MFFLFLKRLYNKRHVNSSFYVHKAKKTLDSSKLKKLLSQKNDNKVNNNKVNDEKNPVLLNSNFKLKNKVINARKINDTKTALKKKSIKLLKI